MGLRGIFGILIFVFAAWLLSSNRKSVSWRLAASSAFLQVMLLILVLGVPQWGVPALLRPFFFWANSFILSFIDFSIEGARFVFGDLVTSSKFGFIFAFQVLPSIVFVSAVFAVFYHLGIMQIVVQFIAWIMLKTLRISGAEALSVAANVFVGQTEAPLVIKPYIAKMTRSELFAVMVAGMASTAGGVMAAYAGLLRERIPDIAGHLLTASVLSAPATFLFAKILIPETERPTTLGQLPKDTTQTSDCNFIEAAARGATEGLSLALNVGAMLIAFIALVALLDGGLNVLGDLINFSEWSGDLVETASVTAPKKLSLSVFAGWAFAPVAWLIGIPWHESISAGNLLGEKLVLNEFVAYVHLADGIGSYSEKTVTILSYALCGFANFSSIAIQIGGIGALVPHRRKDVARLGLKCVLAGTLSTLSVAAMVSVFLP